MLQHTTFLYGFLFLIILWFIFLFLLRKSKTVFHSAILITICFFMVIAGISSAYLGNSYLDRSLNEKRFLLPDDPFIERDHLSYVPTHLSNDSNYHGDVNPEKRFLALGFDDFRGYDFSLIIPLLEKYSGVATFNVISNRASLNRSRTKQINCVLSGGHELGDHSWLHEEYPFSDPLFNGQDPSSLEGNQIPFPSNDELRSDRGDGKNVFGFSLSSTLNETLPHGWDNSLITWADLSDEDCQKIRDSFSVYKNAGGLCTILDTLSNRYLGTSGSSYGSYNKSLGYYTGGIYTGAKTSCNHEIWERILIITDAFYKKQYGLNSPMKVWSKPGSQHSGCAYEKDGKRYYDASFQIPYNYQAKMPSSIYTYDGDQKVRSWNDVLREFGYTSTHDSLYPGKEDGIELPAMAYQYIYNADLSREDAVPFPTNSAVNYLDIATAYPESFFSSSDNKGLQMYLDKGPFYQFIECLRTNTANGMIQGEVIDSDDTYSERVFLEELFHYCKSAGIELITKSQAYDICFHHRISNGNLIYNPRLRNTVLELYGNHDGIPMNPDGYSGDCYVTYTENYTPVLNTQGITSYNHFGIPIGNINYSVTAKGNGSISIYEIRNNNSYVLDSTELTELATISVNAADFKKYNTSFRINEFPDVQNASLLDGKDNKVMGIKIVYSAGLSISDIGLFLIN